MTELSEMPEVIVDYIFSKLELTSKDVTQLGLVSKQFHSKLQKHSTLIFDESDSPPEMELSNMISTLCRYQKHSIPLKKFELRCPESSTRIHEQDRCLELVTSQRGLTHLSLWLPEREVDDIPMPYSVPCSVFELDSLVELSLCCCRVQVPEKIACRNLRKLTLHSVVMGKGMFLNIMRSCPLIEELYITWCSGDFQIDYISASTNLMLYRNLKILRVWNNSEERKYTRGDLILDLPWIEKLEVATYYDKTMSISSDSLEDLHYRFWDNMEGPRQVNINAPNMAGFDFYWYWCDNGNGFREMDFPKLSFAGKSSGWISRVELIMLTKACRSSWLMDAYEILKKLSGALNDSEIASVILDLQSTIPVEADDQMLVSCEKIPGIRHLYIKSSGESFCSSSTRTILDGIFLICRPIWVVFQHRTDTEPLVEVHVKHSTSNQSDILMEMLKDHDQKEDMFSVAFKIIE